MSDKPSAGDRENCRCHRSDEVWKTIPTMPDYSVSSHGRIKGPSGKVLMPSGGGRGYLRVSPHGVTKWLHSLVALAWIGPRPRGLCVAHADHDKTHNCIWNLSYVSYKENMRQSVRDGLTATGNRCARAKLNPEKISAIRNLLYAGHSHRKVAEQFAVDHRTIDRIADGKTWAKVPEFRE